MIVKPRRSNIVIKPEIENRERIVKGIVIPATVKMGRTAFYATVMAVGPGRMTKKGVLIPSQVQVGDRVLLSKWAGTRFFIDGRPYMLIDEIEEVMGIVEQT
jgi:chaperonin GroES